jgi:hypothetical protein
MDDDIEPAAPSSKSPFRAMERAVGVPPRLDHAMMLVANGADQKTAAAAAGISPSRFSVFLRSDRGQTRMNFWIGRRLRSLAPKAVGALDRNLDSKNAMASVRSAESILDRIGMDGDGVKVGGDLIVSINLSGSKRETPEKVIDHE